MLTPPSPFLQLLRTVEALPHWPRVLAAHNNTRISCMRKPAWRSLADGPPYDCKGIYLGAWGA
eukprot:1281625-Pleurochrysis_carterae.AAC.3